jgi:allantoate deiminase
MSGAGHDAMLMGKLAPVTMMFIRCKGGISHNAAEAVEPYDVGMAVKALVAFVERLATA